MNKKYNIKNLKILIKFLNNSNIYSKEYLINLLNQKKRLIKKLNNVINNIDQIIFHIKLMYHQNKIYNNYNLYNYLKITITNKNNIMAKLDIINKKELYIMDKFNIKKSSFANYLFILQKKIKYK